MLPIEPVHINNIHIPNFKFQEADKLFMTS